MEIFSQVWSIIVALLLLSFLVMIHELGHYGVGRFFRFGILEFAIGMGPKIFSRKKNGINYCLRALPIGGSCRFYGEDEKPRDILSFNAQKVWKRFLVILAGPLMNFLLAILFAVIVLCVFGAVVPAVHSYTAENTKAEQAGMLPGDILYAIDGEKIENYGDSVNMIRAAGNDAVITVKRGGELIDLQFHDIYDKELGYNLLGINLTTARSPYGFFEAVGQAFPYVWSIVQEMLRFLGSIFTTGIQQGDILGPVGTITFIGYAVRTSMETVLNLIVLLNINLAIINLLPLPALDGGRLVFLTIEGIRRKPIAQEKEGMVHFVGIILLFGLIIVLTFQDVRHLLGG